MSDLYDAPKSGLGAKSKTDPLLSEVYRLKKSVVFSESTNWPDRCFKCNQPTTFTSTTKLSYVNPWCYLTIFLSLIVLIIVVLIAQKKFVVELPLCDRHHDKMLTKKKIKIATLLLFFGLIGAGIFLENPLLITAGVVTLLVLVLMMIGFKVAYIHSLKEDRLWVKGAGDEFLDSLNVYGES